MISYTKIINPAVWFLRCSRLIIKSDRINALRKQYDAFLEEDKRRKERNDMILNKLDKMRYCNATVPLRATPTLYMNQQTKLHKKENSLDQSLGYDRYLPSPIQQPLGLSNKHLDDTFMLQEITKKYILIPKRSSGFVNEYPVKIKPIVENDCDWKSKYDILNQLKQNDNKAEYEIENSNPTQVKNYLKHDESFLDIPHSEPIVSNYVQEIHVDQQQLLGKNMDDNPEKDVIDTKPYINFKRTESPDQNMTTAPIITSEKDHGKNKTRDLSSKLIYDLECATNIQSAGQDVAEQIIPSHSVVEVDQQIDSNIIAPISNSIKLPSADGQDYKKQVQQEKYLEIQGENNTQECLTAEESAFVSNNPNLYCVQDMKPEISVKETINDNNIATVEDLKLAENVEYPIEIINVEEFTPDENVTLEDGVNINPQFQSENNSVPLESENEIPTEEAENPTDVAEIEEFDAEQRQMFYSDDTNENYVYDQTNPGETYQEYPQNENYQQNAEYAYYESAPQNQTYPTEVNEFEETSQPYDQTYQEQYAAYDPQFVQEETYEQEPQQYEGIQEIDGNIQPEMEQSQYEQLNYQPQNIEQFDNEQAYTENEESETTHNEPAGDKVNVETNDITNQGLNDSNIQENIIQENTLNN